MTTAIGNDAEQQELPSVEWSEDQITEAFLKKAGMPTDADDQPSGSEDKKIQKSKPTETDDNEDEPSEQDAPEDEADDDGEGEETEEDKKARKFAEDSDDTYVKIKVGDDEHEVPVKELKRLWGQESALTKRSQEVAEARKALEADYTKRATSSQALLERARVRWEPYSKIDFLLAAKELPAEDYTALRAQAQAAYEDVQFLEHHTDGFMQAVQAQQNASLMERAKESLKVLTGPADKGGVEGFNEKLYNDIHSFALAEGAPAEIINQLVDPWAIKLIHSAMLYARGKDKAKTVVTRVNKTPKKVVKTSEALNQPARGSHKDNLAAKKAREKAARTGKPEDAAEAIMAGWLLSGDDE